MFFFVYKTETNNLAKKGFKFLLDESFYVAYTYSLNFILQLLAEAKNLD